MTTTSTTPPSDSSSSSNGNNPRYTPQPQSSSTPPYEYPFTAPTTSPIQPTSPPTQRSSSPPSQQTIPMRIDAHNNPSNGFDPNAISLSHVSVPYTHAPPRGTTYSPTHPGLAAAKKAPIPPSLLHRAQKTWAERNEQE